MISLTQTLDKIRAWHQQWPHAAILWSGGKDSTALLHLLKFQAGLNLPVVQYREPKFRERYEYSDRLIKEWGLEVYEYPASRHALADGPDVSTGEMRFDLLKYQQWGQKAIILSLGTERPSEAEIASGRYLCGMDFITRPTGSFNWPWPAVYIGTKGGDTDPIKGSVPLALDVRHAEGSPISLYPLRDWSDEDVYSYLESHEVAPDPNRYEKIDGTWDHKADKSMNADFIPTCLNCVNRHAEAYVECPKLQATVSNISHLVPYEDVVMPDLGFRPVWDEKKVEEAA